MQSVTMLRLAARPAIHCLNLEPRVSHLQCGMASSLHAPRHTRPGARALAAGCGTLASAEARNRFLSILQQKHGDTKDAVVVEQLQLLQKANPTPDAALSGEYLDGDWLQISQSDYPNRLSKQEPLYKLGRLAFNMYEPLEAVFRIDRVWAPVRPCPNSGDSSRLYDIFVEVTCVDEKYPEFKAVMSNYASITPARDASGNHARLTVSFTHGDLAPSPELSEHLKAAWRQTFSPKQRNIVMRGIMRLAMGFETTPMDEDGAMSYKLRRAPKGWLDIVYLDDVLRVTRGNRGSVVVCERS